MRERTPGVWEIVVQAGRDPITGKHRQISRTFRGSLREAKKARAELIVEVGKGRHTGSRATLDDLFGEWIIELRRKGRSPNTIDGYEQVYRRNIQPTLGGKQVTKLTVKMLTDLYGAHQARGLAPRTVYQIHACLSSMLTQACRWGWRDSNPAQWAEPPSIPNKEPTVPTPEEVRALIAEAERGKRPEMARAILVAATTGVRRAELCGLRWDRDVDLEHRVMRVSASVTKLRGRPIEEIPTKNRSERTLAIDDFTAAILRAQIEEVERRAEFAQVALVENPYVRCHRKSARQPGAFRHQVVAMIHQQPHLTSRAIETRRRQIRFLQRSASNGEYVDRIGLAIGARTRAGVRHHLRWHHDRFPRSKQIAFQPPREMPAVLDRPPAIKAKLLGPTQHVEMISCGGRVRGLLAQLAAGRVDRDDGVGALVPINPKYQHGLVTFHSVTRTGRWAHLSEGDATLLSSHTGRSD
jgi:integrase